MEFGKLENVDSVDWTIPEDDQVSVAFLQRLRALRPSSPDGNRLDLRFGAPAWGRKEWIGKIYPEKTKASDFLRYYASHFSTIELNTSHYRIPSLDQVAKWRSQVASDFLFCPKVFQGISHERFGFRNRALIGEWIRFQLSLEEHGGPSFLQLPPYFDYSMKAELFELLKQWPREARLALEFRHPSWFENGRILPKLTEYLQTRGIGLVQTDVAGRRDVLHTSISSEFSMLRFIGNNLHPSDTSRAESWSTRIAQWESFGLQRFFLFIHEPDDVSTPEMTEIFLRSLERTGEFKFSERKLRSLASISQREGLQFALERPIES